MASDLIQRSLSLTPGEWKRLEQLAELHHTPALTGPNAGEPSWRSLIRAIAQDKFILTRMPKKAEPESGS